MWAMSSSCQPALENPSSSVHGRALEQEEVHTRGMLRAALHHSSVCAAGRGLRSDRGTGPCSDPPRLNNDSRRRSGELPESWAPFIACAWLPYSDHHVPFPAKGSNTFQNTKPFTPLQP